MFTVTTYNDAVHVETFCIPVWIKHFNYIIVIVFIISEIFVCEISDLQITVLNLVDVRQPIMLLAYNCTFFLLNC
jgi:hypothetical protein